MPHSLRAQLSTLRYKGLLKDSEYERLRYALDVVDGRVKPDKRNRSKKKVDKNAKFKDTTGV